MIFVSDPTGGSSRYCYGTLRCLLYKEIRSYLSIHWKSNHKFINFSSTNMLCIPPISGMEKKVYTHISFNWSITFFFVKIESLRNILINKILLDKSIVMHFETWLTHFPGCATSVGCVMAHEGCYHVWILKAGICWRFAIFRVNTFWFTFLLIDW